MNKQALLEERAVEVEQRNHRERQVNSEVPKSFTERYGFEYYNSVIKYLLNRRLSYN